MGPIITARAERVTAYLIAQSVERGRSVDLTAPALATVLGFTLGQLRPALRVACEEGYLIDRRYMGAGRVYYAPSAKAYIGQIRALSGRAAG